MTSDPHLAISHHRENRVPGGKAGKMQQLLAAVARLSGLRAVGLGRQAQGSS